MRARHFKSYGDTTSCNRKPGSLDLDSDWYASNVYCFLSRFWWRITISCLLASQIKWLLSTSWNRKTIPFIISPSTKQHFMNETIENMIPIAHQLNTDSSLLEFDQKHNHSNIRDWISFLVSSVSCSKWHLIRLLIMPWHAEPMMFPRQSLKLIWKTSQVVAIDKICNKIVG